MTVAEEKFYRDFSVLVAEIIKIREELSLIRCMLKNKEEK